MKFWKSLQFTNTEDMLAIASIADNDTRFHGVYLGDHWVAAHGSAGYPTTPDGRAPFPDSTHWPHIGSMLGAILATTVRVHVSTSVMLLPLYNAFDVARMCGTLAVLSNNRLSLGVAPGWSRDDYSAVGVPFTDRGRRMDESLDVVRALLAGGEVEHHGEFYDFEPLEIQPRPDRPVPMLTGGFTDRALRRAVEKADGWVGAPLDPSQLTDNISKLTAMLSDAGRARESFEIRVPFRGDDIDYLRRLEELGVDSILCTPPADHFAKPQPRQKKIDEMFRMNEVVCKFLEH
ncbi:TIGR03619 family F420-dependent LLM class oxidoreductase [Nocardia vinacea]|uniref:TIGR03619 family F420-dependent LLM class oxidoreductase n=1 Tax=Nocardia vinacea TaxID=96468 RepID=UPI000686B315|nr:TIGR03619 family F420-dependent LLM class oxidoreductase [Nocardia vinacea]